MIHPDGCQQHDHCKVNVIRHLMERFDLPVENILAVGDGENDVCMLKAAGNSIAFMPKSKRVRNAAKNRASRLQEILFMAGALNQRRPLVEVDGEVVSESLSN
jgi:phosphoserine phosphatase